MKIGILGYGKEGESAEKYFKKHGANIKIFDKFSPDTAGDLDLSDLDVIVRSPSIPPLQYWPTTPASLSPQTKWESVTQYFFAHCPAPIIGVTGTKGKGTTSSLTAQLLRDLGVRAWLIGNIGTPATDVLDEIQPGDVVVYEMSNFQLWDLEKSPHIAIVVRIEPDHLNVHPSFEDYVNAKSNIARHQTPDDTCIYYSPNQESTKIAQLSPGHKIAYPLDDSADRTILDHLLDHLYIPGQHNRNNAEAALLAVSSYFNLPLTDFIQQNSDSIIHTFETFPGLPHRLQFVRELNGVKYYDDNFSSAFPATDVALATFPNQPIFLIAGGLDRGLDHTPAQQRIFKNTPNLRKAFLIGQTSTKLAADQDPSRYQLCQTLAEAFNAARTAAEAESARTGQTVILLMSPGAPSFDMFKNFADRGQQFQKLVEAL